MTPRGCRQALLGTLVLVVAGGASGCGEPDPVLTRAEPGVACARAGGARAARPPVAAAPDELLELLEAATWVAWGEVVEIVPPDDDRAALVTVAVDTLLAGPCDADRLSVSVTGRLGVGVGSGAVVIAEDRERPVALAPLDAFGVEDLEEAYATGLVERDRQAIPADQDPCQDPAAVPRAEPFRTPTDPEVAALVSETAWVVLGRVAAGDRDDAAPGADEPEEDDAARVVLVVDRVLRGHCDLASIPAAAPGRLPPAGAVRIWILEFGVSGFEVVATPESPPPARWEAALSP